MIEPLTKYCPSCKKTKSSDLFGKVKSRGDGLRWYCKKCTIKKANGNSDYFTKYMKVWRKRHPEQVIKTRIRNAIYQKNNPEKNLAHVLVYNAIKNGELIRKPCEICGDTNSEGHHWHGYDKEHQLDVQWLCRKHHARTDRSKKYY